MSSTEDGLGADLAFWISLTRVTGIGPRRFDLLLETFGTAEKAWLASMTDLLQAGLDRRSADSLIVARRKVDPSREVDNIRARGIRAITKRDSDYPEQLAEIYDAPPVLYVRGELGTADALALAIVGTRGASTYGRMAAEQLAIELARAGVTIVSGLALGVDTAAHRGALQGGGRTIAVLASGLDRIYPSQNAGLADEISRNGALVTEFPLGIKPDAVNFPRRNRIISGLTRGTLVVEAGERSGALITAAFAAEQGREVLAVPGSIFSSKSKGTNALIRDGATPVTSADDVLAELRPNHQPRQLSIADIVPLDETERVLVNVLKGDPVHIDEIAREAALPMSLVSAALAMMELKGIVRQLGGMHYVRGGA
ncbi:MAG: DNA-protecting protein DprA [Chloroflexi bacterium]|nr:DNA-protecting protein DprA [Chloroflexota bacterium]